MLAANTTLMQRVCSLKLLQALHSDEPRNASVVADEDCHVCIISRRDYQQAVKAVRDAEIKERAGFLSEHSPAFMDLKQEVRWTVISSLASL